MSDNSDRAAWQVTTDHDRIREWAGQHETVPVLADVSGGPELRLLSNPADDRGDQLSWQQFFERFETESLALRYRETATRGEGQPAYELVARDEITDADSSVREDSDALEEDAQDDERQPTPPGTEGTGVTQVDSETARGDEATAKSGSASDGDDAEERDTAMSAASRDAETGGFVLDEIHEEHGLGDDVEDEYLTFRNTGDEALDLSEWVVENEAGQRFVFSDVFTLDAGETVTVHSGPGDDTETDVYWGATSQVWDDDGDTIVVRTADGREVVREPYLK